MQAYVHMCMYVITKMISLGRETTPKLHSLGHFMVYCIEKFGERKQICCNRILARINVS